MVNKRRKQEEEKRAAAAGFSSLPCCIRLGQKWEKRGLCTWGPSGSYHLNYGRARYITIGTPNEIDEEKKIVRQNIWFPKSILLMGFGDIGIRVQILDKRLFCPSRLEIGFRSLK